MGYSTGCKFGTATTVGVVLSTLGAVFVVYWPVVFNNVLNDQLALSETSRSFSLWEVTPIPMYIEFYFFNWTNSKDVKSLTTKPILQELGPYVFKEHRKKVIKGWFPENNTVTFLQNRTWIFEPSLSNGSLTDLVFTINIPAVTAAFAVRNKTLETFFLNQAMRVLGTKLLVKKTVGEFLFDGYRDPLLDLASIIPPNLAPVTIPFDKFGWFYTRNGSATYDGVFNMYTGKDDITKFGKVGEWNYENSTRYYESFCGNVNGSAGEFFPPKRTKTSISLFSPDVCRTLTLSYKEEVRVDGISGYRYWGDDTMLDNKTTCADNWCFCPSGDCAPNGAIDVSTCKWGAPAFISFPHFYHADPWYREVVVGMKPEMDKHQMFIDIEPNSGIPLQVSAALQINILLQPYEGVSIFRGVPKIYFPAIWFKQTARIDDEIGPQVKLLSLLPSIGAITFYVILSLGVTILLVVGICYLTMRCRKDEDTVILTSIFGVTALKKRLMKILRHRLCVKKSKKLRTDRIQPEPVVMVHNWAGDVRSGDSKDIHFKRELSDKVSLMSQTPTSSGIALVISNTNKCVRRHSQISAMFGNDDEERSPLYEDPSY